MRRDSSSVRKSRENRARPILEGLEDRWVLSLPPGGTAIVAAQASGGVFSANFHQFRYTTSQGTQVLIQLNGKGSLQGSYVDSQGLHLVYSKTNSATKIVSSVHGGTGRAPLASIVSLDLLQNGAQGSLNGVGSTLVRLVNLRNFDLVSGGFVNLSAGIGTIALRSMAPNSELHLREIPTSQDLVAQLQASVAAANSSSGSSSSSSSNSSFTRSVTSGTTSSSSSSSSSGSTSTGTYITNAFLVQTLAGSEGEFVSAGNLILTSTGGDPGPPPAPPGVVVKVDHINGSLTEPVNLQTDGRIFGYDPQAGQILRFALDLTGGTGAVDTSFTPIAIQPQGTSTTVSLSVGRAGNRLALLADTGPTIFAYDATYGTPLGSFSTGNLFTAPAAGQVTFPSLGSTSYLSVAGQTSVTASAGGNAQSSQLALIDIAASLSSGQAKLAPGNTKLYTPPGGVSLLGGLSGIPGSIRVYSTVAAAFNSLQPIQTQLGLLTVSTASATGQSGGGLALSNALSTVGQSAIQRSGNFVNVGTVVGPQTYVSSLGSIDQNLALNQSSTTNPSQTNVITLLGPVSLRSKGTIVLNYANPLTDLSEAFRPDLAGSALIDVQGNVQSVRGKDATGLVLNDTGNLNLVKFARMSNSTIAGEPFGHLEVGQRSNVSIISTTRTVGDRNGVTQIPGLQPIGPLSLPNNSPQ